MTESNPQLSLARSIVENTGTHLFLTGKAGTGKTTFLRRLRDESPKRMLVAAPTGIAAINAGGVTLHSLFQLPFAPYVPGASYAAKEKFKVNRQKIRLIQSIDLLVIDEISMVRADLLDAVDAALRRMRRNGQPFGGVQLLLIGDLQQLAPVVKEEEWSLLKNYYDTPYFFSSQALRRTQYATIELTHVYRQRDAAFLSLLNNIREGKADPSTLQALNSRYIPHFVPDGKEGYIRLVTHNWQAQEVNTSELAKLPGKAFTYQASVRGNFPELSFPTEAQLTLKRGAQVMFVKNDMEKRYFNGMIGEIVEIDSKGFKVRPKGNGEDEDIAVKLEEWTNTRYGLDEETKEIKEIVEGTFVQFPVKLAWAITIHKSQGLTFKRVMIDASRSFAHGQTYVALSRCTTLEGIVLTSPIPPAAVIADPGVATFNEQMRSRIIGEEDLRQMQHNFSLTLLTQLFTFEKERVALAQIVRLLEEFLSHTYPETMNAYEDCLQAFDSQVMGVASRFHVQYDRLLTEKAGDVEGETLQERIRKGAHYFLSQLRPVHHLAGTTRLDIDNSQTAQRMAEVLFDLGHTAAVHVKLLEYVSEKGFHPAAYMDARAKIMLNMEGKTRDTQERGKAERGKASKASAPKYLVPTEVKNAALYYRLQQWRRNKAREAGKPPYTFLQTKALMAMADYVPSDMRELAAIPYFGAKSAEKYGAEILAVINEYRQDREAGKIKEDEDAAKKISLAASGEKTWETTLRLYKEGNSPARIAELRDLTVGTIVSHLARYMDSGEIDFFKLVTPSHYQRIKEWLSAHPFKPELRLTDIRMELGDDISFNDLRLTIKREKWEEAKP